MFYTKVVFLMTNEFKDFWTQMAFHQSALNSRLGPLITGKVLFCLTGSILGNIYCGGHQVMTSFMRVIWLAEPKMSFDSTQCFIGCYSRDVFVAGQPDKTFCLMLALLLSVSYCMFVVQRWVVIKNLALKSRSVASKMNTIIHTCLPETSFRLQLFTFLSDWFFNIR